MAPSDSPGRQPDSPVLARVKRVLEFASKHAIPGIGLPTAAALAFKLQGMWATGELQQLLMLARETTWTFDLFTLVAVCALVLSAALAWHLLHKPTIYLVDYIAQRPDDSWKHSRLDSEAYAENSQVFTPEAVDFQRKVLWFGGLGNETYLPPWLGNYPQTTSMEKAKLEFDLVVVRACTDLLEKTGVKPSQVGILVVNCSLFCPTPSLCAHIMNHFKMGKSTITYNLGGMGCSASPIAVDLARQMLQLYPDTYALVVSTENITQNMYKGTQRSMLIPNVLFRVGGAAMLMTNKRSEAWRAKYKLDSVVRTTLSGDDTSYNCVMEMEDSLGNRGVKLSKELMKIAGKSLKDNITTLGPRVLPLSEMLVFGANLVARKLLKLRMAPYIPDFQVAAQHICIHTGGRGVIDAIQKELGLSNEFVEPSRAALYRYGNVSSSSVWYVLAYIEHYRGVTKGDKVLQLAFGSGFKCNSAVWVANRTFKEQCYAWEGFDLQAMYEDLSTLEIKLNKLLEQIGKKPMSPIPMPGAKLAAADALPAAKAVATH
ncbi:FAE1/Type III polyketide synthase-like protein-domain-containing protein [Scenedesmus sp. NREL 46B-D3]|nr:FAE1/Type III polyketide synthase-like protein-domain-containing protein [Scenedesmus sp. NREL 46B-D3]